MAGELARAQAHLQRIGSAPRAAGSAAEAAARRYAAGVLTEAGFAVEHAPFTYSAFPGRFATPLIGAAGCVAIASAGHLASRGHAAPALAILIVVAIVAAITGRWLARDGVLDLRTMRREGVNLVATRGDASPRVWLVAHVDTKSQPVPQALRAAGIVGLALVWLLAAVLAAAQARAVIDPGMPGWIAVTLAGIFFGAPVVLSLVGNASDGALDNASGVTAVLLAAERIPRDTPVGVLITSAEELGLAGARAWARQQPGSGRVALNCDGIADDGALAVIAGAGSTRVREALHAGATQAGRPARTMRLLPGVLTDAVALAAAGWETATLCRGTLATLARVHTRRDTLAGLQGTGVPEAAIALTVAAERLAHGRTA